VVRADDGCVPALADRAALHQMSDDHCMHLGTWRHWCVPSQSGLSTTARPACSEISALRRPSVWSQLQVPARQRRASPHAGQPAEHRAAAASSSASGDPGGDRQPAGEHGGRLAAHPERGPSGSPRSAMRSRPSWSCRRPSPGSSGFASAQSSASPASARWIDGPACRPGAQRVSLRRRTTWFCERLVVDARQDRAASPPDRARLVLVWLVSLQRQVGRQAQVIRER
jgi:hypothetical protein